MSKGKRLSVMGPQESKLGRSTVMDRALAQQHGSAYVHLAAFAIDVDRVRTLDPDDTLAPFGFEVALTEAYLTHLFVPMHRERARSVIEDAVLSILELPAPRDDEEPALGSQLGFAVYCGVARGTLPGELASCFRAWKKGPRELLDDTATLLSPERIEALAAHCLEAALTPPLAPPTQEALSVLARR